MKSEMPLAALGYHMCKNNQSATVFPTMPFFPLTKASNNAIPCPLDAIPISKCTYKVESNHTASQSMASVINSHSPG